MLRNKITVTVTQIDSERPERYPAPMARLARIVVPVRILLVLVATFFSVLPLSGKAGTASVLETLKQPGIHAIMRHALAPGTGDPAAFQIGDCSTQRNLDERGREQARSLGRALKTAGIVFDRVLTSQWCRCRETADVLEFGKPIDFPGLNSFYQNRSTADAQTEEVREFLRSLSESETVLLVTHQVNITALTGRSVSSGEVFLVRTGPDGNVRVIAAFLIPAI